MAVMGRGKAMRILKRAKLNVCGKRTINYQRSFCAVVLLLVQRVNALSGTAAVVTGQRRTNSFTVIIVIISCTRQC